jgi:hypothetical protein
MSQQKTPFNLQVSARSEYLPTATGSPQPSLADLTRASCRSDKDDLEAPKLDVQYASKELDVRRLNDIHHWLWMAGRPRPSRCLHEHKMMDRTIVVTEQADLHMAWSARYIFVKPIPRFLLEHEFWEKVLGCQPRDSPLTCETIGLASDCQEKQLHKSCVGFLLSYTALVSYESDFHLAREAHLIPGDDMTWWKWKKFVSELLDSNAEVNERYHYGELRLHRLNLIYRLAGINVLDGYLPDHEEYSSFLRSNLLWIAASTVYIGIVLTAMQVGLATTRLSSNVRFQSASSGFTVFAILGPLIAAAIVAICFAFALLYNLIVTSQYRKERFRTINEKAARAP